LPSVIKNTLGGCDLAGAQTLYVAYYIAKSYVGQGLYRLEMAAWAKNNLFWLLHDGGFLLVHSQNMSQSTNRAVKTTHWGTSPLIN